MPKHQPRERAQAPARPDGKKPYRAPRLTKYGNLRTITQGKGGNMSDGTGLPATRK
jgi:hypothetical protein